MAIVVCDDAVTNLRQREVEQSKPGRSHGHDSQLYVQDIRIVCSSYSIVAAPSTLLPSADGKILTSFVSRGK